MTKQEIKEILQQGETETTEFKQSFNKSVIESIVAFSNTKGGKVIIGVKNNGEIAGISITEETVQKWINEIKQNTEPSLIPDIEIISIDNKNIVIIKIREFPVKPVSYRDRFYIRKLNSNHKLSASEISDVYMYSTQYSWDAYINKDASINDLNLNLVKRFINKVNKEKRFHLPDDINDALNKLKLIKKNKITNAAAVLFSNDIFKFNIHIGRFKTSSYIIADDIISGNLYSVLEKSMQKIISHLKFAFEITGETTQRTEIPEYPLEAIRELLVYPVRYLYIFVN